uniref:Reverse transcriptase Ty1/copia-type domain-containing protein n=1 Tax=Tanacetum cinerariifolium TaxID=118510 RepID=A0A6L2L092_TANCI|nr:hypothetical protein [Tanacetum cinerariifolium]
MTHVSSLGYHPLASDLRGYGDTYAPISATEYTVFHIDEPLKQTRKRCKWENDDYICHERILNDMSDALFDVYQNVGSANKLWDQLESKYMAEDAYSKKFLGEAMLTACYLLNKVPNKRNKVTPYELFYKKRPNLSYLRVWGCMAVVRLPELKKKNLGEKVIESRDAMFDEKRFTSIPRPKSPMPSSNEDQIGETPIETPTTRRSNRARVDKSFGSDFQLYLVEGSRDEIGTQLQINLQKKTKVYGTIDKFKVRLVIQGFRQKEEINYFDTYAHVARISTIRLLIALATTYNLVIYQMDVKITFLNDDLKEETPKQWHQIFDEVVLSSGFVLNQCDKCVYCKFDKSGIKREDKYITIAQLHYIEKILKKFECGDCCPVSTPLDPTIKLMPNIGRAVDQLEYSRAIGCLMYAMTSTRLDIAYVVDKLSRYTSNLSTHLWHAVMMVFKYLKKTMDYGLSYVGFPSVLEGYSDASWITNSEYHTSTTEMGTMGMVFLSFYFCILFLSVDGNSEPSAYEVLKSYNLPIGVLPRGALGYTLDRNSGAKNEWGLSPKTKVRVLHTAQLDVTVNSNH